MQVHRDDVVGTGACEEIGDQCAGLSNPLAVSHLGLESWGLGDRLCGNAVCAIGAVEVHRALWLGRVGGLAAPQPVHLHRAGRVRGPVTLLVQLHATQLMVQCRRAIGAQAGALRLARVRCLRARLEAVCTSPRP